MQACSNWKVPVACLAGGLVAGFAIATSWNWTWAEDANNWEMWSALGTIAAAVVALGIALSEGVRRTRDERTRTWLAAGNIVEQMSKTCELVQVHRDGLQKWIQKPDDLIVADLQSTRHALGNSSQLFGRAAELVSLPNDCARNIATAVDMLKRADADLNIALSSSPPPPGPSKPELASDSLNRLDRALILLKSALAECRKASGYEI